MRSDKGNLIGDRAMVVEDRMAGHPIQPRRAGFALLLFTLIAACVSARGAAADDAVWSALRAGGHIVLMRHGATTPGVGDPAGMRLDDCSTQRNLNDEGRRESHGVGEAFRTRGIVVDRVLSSPWCRCLETARLAFGRAETWLPLSNLFGRPENAAAQVREMRALVGERRSGGNLVLVSHGSTILALTGVNLGTAEAVVTRPLGNGEFSVVGRLAVSPR
jgi:broad specificity phosphatase PhoE